MLSKTLLLCLWLFAYVFLLKYQYVKGHISLVASGWHVICNYMMYTTEVIKENGHILGSDIDNAYDNKYCEP